MTVHIEQPRFEVHFRPPGVRKWQTVATCESAAVAWQTVTDLMSTRRGDFAVRQVPGTCMELPGAGESS